MGGLHIDANGCFLFCSADVALVSAVVLVDTAKSIIRFFNLRSTTPARDANEYGLGSGLPPFHAQPGLFTGRNILTCSSTIIRTLIYAVSLSSVLVTPMAQLIMFVRFFNPKWTQLARGSSVSPVVSSCIVLYQTVSQTTDC